MRTGTRGGRSLPEKVLRILVGEAITIMSSSSSVVIAVVAVVAVVVVVGAATVIAG